MYNTGMSKRQEFVVTGPLPARKAYHALRRQIAEHLTRTSPAPGDRFLSDHELVRTSGLARNTVRRAVSLLVKDGWLERQHGKGTFVGPRVGRAVFPQDVWADSLISGPAEAPALHNHRDPVRLAVLLGWPAGSRQNWYSMEVLQGLEEKAMDENILIDLFNFGTSTDHVRGRLQQSRPDVLACLSPEPKWAQLVVETRSRGVPVILTGTRLAHIGLPVIHEDGAGGSELAVNHLLERGHRRILFVQDTVPAPWAFDRFNGFVRAMNAAGLDPDDGCTLWLDREIGGEGHERLAKTLQKQCPTAVILGSGGLVRLLGLAAAESGLRVPDDLSVITFDQRVGEPEWMGGKTLTTIALPLIETGRLLAVHVREAAERRLPEKLPVLPCRLIGGDSVLSLK